MQNQQGQQASMRQNSEQERGRQAWSNILAIKEQDQKSPDKKLEKEYRSLARGLNAMVQINGLGQTLGFLKAKGKHDEKKAHYLLLSHLTGWMQDAKHFKAANRDVMGRGYDGLLHWVLDPATSSDDYRRATTECLAFGVWLRR
ncbi:MAG: type III-B CRISPR module-associated protein Cmr5, partial [Ktedonobacteraceae bacterium]